MHVPKYKLHSRFNEIEKKTQQISKAIYSIIEMTISNKVRLDI